jgi:hypothetical protein
MNINAGGNKMRSKFQDTTIMQPANYRYQHSALNNNQQLQQQQQHSNENEFTSAELNKQNGLGLKT